jgi:hypothetical protein
MVHTQTSLNSSSSNRQTTFIRLLNVLRMVDRWHRFCESSSSHSALTNHCFYVGPLTTAKSPVDIQGLRPKVHSWTCHSCSLSFIDINHSKSIVLSIAPIKVIQSLSALRFNLSQKESNHVNRRLSSLSRHHWFIHFWRSVNGVPSLTTLTDSEKAKNSQNINRDDPDDLRGSCLQKLIRIPQE